jgi:hypothetical protein
MVSLFQISITVTSEPNRVLSNKHNPFLTIPIAMGLGAGSLLLVAKRGRAFFQVVYFLPVIIARILERQNVQTSQVLFRRICVSLAMVLPFKDSEGWTCS